ncbi:hypothetical protein [Bifidobacterium catenulatum]|uniref:hypothetical protein n=1 Tax=Bifidobacterium catenulatum TaxID=1686 RepID=UPI0016423BAA|nr:hypothetical protein [Bifidobacterium catenulatum]
MELDEAATIPTVKPTSNAAVMAATARKIFIRSDIERKFFFHWKLGFHQSANGPRP